MISWHCRCDRSEVPGLDGIVFRGGNEPGEVLARGSALNLDAQLALFFRAGFSKDGNCAEGFGIDAGNEESFPGL